MALSILNNITAIGAQNQLATTQANLQRTLTQLSSGQRINSGADDAAGLSIANGIQANVAALTQSAQNAANGIGEMQVADGALSQVTALLNRAVTLATEASNGTLDAAGKQGTALDTEFGAILTEINSIGTNTKFNGTAVFGTTSAGNTLNVFMSDGTTANAMSTSITINQLSSAKLGLSGVAAKVTLSGSGNVAANNTVTIGGQAYIFKDATNLLADETDSGGAIANTVLLGATLQDSLTNLAAAINHTGSAGTQYTSSTLANASVSAGAAGASTLQLTAKTLGTAGNSIAVSVGGGATAIGFPDAVSGNMSGGAGGALSLTSATNAQAALSAINSAISTVAAWRGSVGATINQTKAATNVMNTQVQNLTSAESDITSADIGKTVADMTKFNILQSTGMSALQQSNQAQQSVLKLLQ